MASAPRGDEAGEKQKVSTYKVYTRKSFKNRANKLTGDAVAVNSTTTATGTGDNNSGGDGGAKGNIDNNNNGTEKIEASPQTLALEEPNSGKEQSISRSNEELDNSSSLNGQQGAVTSTQDSQQLTTWYNEARDNSLSLNREQDVITSIQDSQQSISRLNEVPDNSMSVDRDQGAITGILDLQQPVGCSNEVPDNSLSLHREQGTVRYNQDSQQLDDCMNEVPDNSCSLNREQGTITSMQESQQPVNHMSEVPSNSLSLDKQQGPNMGVQDPQQPICRLGEAPSNSLGHGRQQVVIVSTQNEVPTNSLSLSRQQGEITSTQDLQQQPHGERNLGPGDRIKINLASRTKQDLRELRRKLEGELDVVRSLVKRIEAKEVEIGSVNVPHDFARHGFNNGSGAGRVPSELAPVSIHHEARPLNRLSVPVLDNIHGATPVVEKEKRTPKANQFYRNSEFLLAKDKFPPAESNKKSKSNAKKQASGGDVGIGFAMGAKFFKSCSSLLEKLLKHKHAWVFKDPVDVEDLGLHDYYAIIKHPMDLGTIKSRLHKNWYKSPKEFAEDVRLTFNNAMTYNPKGHDVHIMAEQLLKIFEDRWAIIESDYNREMRFGMDYESSFHTQIPRMGPRPRPPPLVTRRVLDRSESMTQTVYQKPKPMSITPSARTPAPKKPKAKDPHKRDMTFEEKQKLSANLQNLPSEKLDSIVQIIKKRSSAVLQQNDEIEVDIDRVDTETLWELDRFVTNYKKSLSKNKRKAERAIQARAEALQNIQEKDAPPVVAELPKEAGTEEPNILSSGLAQGEKQGDSRSTSSSSSSSSSDSGSSTSDSDSESSSSSVSIVGNSPRD